MATPTYIGEADVKENLQIAKEIQSPQGWDEERRRDEKFFEDHHRALADDEKRVIDELLTNENEQFSYITEYMIDEQEKEMLELVRLVFTSSDDFELGRKFREIAQAVKSSYVTMVK